MIHETTNKPIENYVHKTQSRPFSLHHITVHPYHQVLYLHCHTELELFYLVSGTVDFFIEERKFTLNSGDAIMVPPGLLHFAGANKPENEQCEFYAIVFSEAMLTEILPSYCERYLLPVNYHTMDCIIPIYRTDTDSWQSTVLSCLNTIFKTMDKDIKYYELIIRGNLLIIWQLLYNNHMHALMKNSANEHIQPYLKKCVDFIDENYMNPLTLDEMADCAGLSNGHFCRQFKEFTGYTPFSYLNKIRITRSCDFLLNTEKKIAEIASLCGFNNISYYNRAFVRLMKETPSSYRKNYK